MKTRTILALTLVLSFVLGGIAMAASVTPYTYEMCRGSVLSQHPDPDSACLLATGDAYYECDQVGEYDFAKRTGAVDGEFHLVETGTFVQWVTISRCNGEFAYDENENACYRFDWAATPNEVGAVIVKSVGKGMKNGGFNAFTYDPAVPGDEELYGVNELAINHITFCWDVADVCMRDETAWAAGEEFNPASGWAMYVDYWAEYNSPDNDEYPDSFTVDLIAGQNEVAGTVTFSAPVNDEVTITITLNEDWIFYYDIEDDEADDNIKIQDYAAEPNANTKLAIGLFDWKAAAEIDDDSFTITVDENNFYAVHVDLATGEPCDE